MCNLHCNFLEKVLDRIKITANNKCNEHQKENYMKNEIKVGNLLTDKKYNDVLLNSNTDIYELLDFLKNDGVNIISGDPDNSIISRKIYQKVFPLYDGNNCRGDTMNTYNSTFGKENNYRLIQMIEKENITNKRKGDIIKKVVSFSHIYHSIGNFAVLERWHKKNEFPCINSARGMGSLRDSWPLTLLCIKDYLSGYKILCKNGLKDSFDNNGATIMFFKNYKEIENGFNKFCDDEYLSPRFYKNKPELAYVSENNYGHYEVRLDLFEGLNFNKPLPETISEIEQFIQNTTSKIVARGDIILNKYLA
jgi:hypothetical protein